MSSLGERFSKIGLLTALILIVGWLISIRGFTSYRDAFGTPIGPDFLQFYTGAKLFAEGASHSLYDFKVQIEAQSEILNSRQDYLHPYIYPPLFAWVLHPLAAFDYRVAFGLWSILGLFILGGVGRWLRLSIVYSLGWFPVFAALSYGQNSFLSLGIIALMGWMWIEKKYPLVAGLTAGFLLYKPQLFVALIPIFLILKEWRILLGMFLSGGIYLLFSYYLVPEQTIEYQRFVMERIPLLVAAPGFPITQFFDTKGFFRLLFPQIGSGIQSALYILVMLFFLQLFWSWLKSIPEENKRLRMVGLVLVIPWTNPYFLVYDWTLLLIAYGLLKNQGSILESDQGKKGIVLIWLVSILSCAIASKMFDCWGVAIQFAPLVLAYFTYRFFSGTEGLNLEKAVGTMRTPI